MPTIIVAADENGVIGDGKKIPWYLPEDLAFFKATTMGHSVIMGRKTWDTLPKRPLMKRVNYIISRQNLRADPHKTIEEGLCGPIFCKNMIEALEDAVKNEGKDIFIIGGAEIYQLALETGAVNKIILSQVQGKHDGNKFFFVPKNFRETSRKAHKDFVVIEYELIS
jgi:dihydrofolate reductase